MSGTIFDCNKYTVVIKITLYIIVRQLLSGSTFVSVILRLSRLVELTLGVRVGML